jgi:hypothetical protein
LSEEAAAAGAGAETAGVLALSDDLLALEALSLLPPDDFVSDDLGLALP